MAAKKAGTGGRQVEYRPLASLEGDPRNPKSHDVGTITASVDRFGYLEPIVVDGRTGLIVSGHGRAATLRAMRDRGEAPPEGVREEPPGVWMVPVVTGWSSRSDSEAAAALIALNRTTELGGWVDDALVGLLGELAEVPDGLVGVGYTSSDLDHLRDQLDTLDNNDNDGEEPFAGFEHPDTRGAVDVECPACGHPFTV